MADIMYFGTDDRIPKVLTEFFAEQRALGADTSSLIHVKDEKALAEALIAMVFSLIIFEQKALYFPALEVTNQFISQRRYKGKLILAGDDNDPTKILRLLEAGWTDYMIMPPDRPLLIEKAELYSKGTRSNSRQVYSLQMSQTADVAKPGTLEELSEFGCKLKSQVAFAADELVVIYSAALSADGKTVGSTLARCFGCDPHPSAPGYHLNHFSFTGIPTETLQNIRNHLRKAYASGKAR